MHVNSIGDYYAINMLVTLVNDEIEKIITTFEGDKVTANEKVRNAVLVSSLPRQIEFAITSTGDKQILDILAREIIHNMDCLLSNNALQQLELTSTFMLMV